MRQWSAGENAVFAVVLLYPWGLIVLDLRTDWCIVGLGNKPKKIIIIILTVLSW